MIDKRLAIKILDILNSGGASFSEIYVQKRVSNSIRIEDKKIEESNSGFDMGCGLRLWKDDSTFYGYVDSLEKGKLIEAAEILGAAVKSSCTGKTIDLNGELKTTASSSSTSIKKYPVDTPAETKKEILENIDIICRSYDNRITQVSSAISDTCNYSVS